MPRNINSILMISILLSLSLIASAAASDYYVDAASGSDSNTGGQGDPWKTITHALASVSGSSGNPVTLHIAAGTYASSTNGETFPLNMKSWVSLSGEDRDTTTLDAEDAAYHVIYCDSVNNLTIEGLTITGGKANGSSYDQCGGGIFSRDSGLLIADNIVRDNSAYHDGGGIYVNLGSVLINGNVITGNRTTNVGHGGGLYLVNCSSMVKNNVICSNKSKIKGGGIYENTTSSLEILNNLIAENDAEDTGGAIYCRSGSPNIANCTIASNTSSGGDGGGIRCYDDASPVVIDSILWGNSPDQVYLEGSSSINITYSCIQDWSSGGTGNISDNPLFVSGYYLSQKSAGQSANSPCVDAGSDTAANLGMDDRTTRTDGVSDAGAVDMGYHYGAIHYYYVDAASGDNSNDGSPESPWKTITHALASVSGTQSDPVIIDIGAGTYASSTNGEAFPLNMESWVSLSGEDRNTTVLDAEDAAYHVILCDGVSNLTIGGLTIKGGRANGSGSDSATGAVQDDDGAGIFCVNCSAVTIEGNLINDNESDDDGGGMFCDNSEVTISANSISANQSGDDGAGLNFWYGSVTVSDNVIADNASSAHGGGLQSVTSSPTIENNVITGNSANHGGGITMSGAGSGTPTIANNLITGNTATDNGGGIEFSSGSCDVSNTTIADNTAGGTGGGIGLYDSDVTVINSILWADSPHEIYVDGVSSIDITYSCILGDYDGDGNICYDPIFVTGPDSNYYLSHTAAGQGSQSPCVNTGSDTAANLGMDERSTRTDFWRDTSKVDMGYHFPAESLHYYVDGDSGDDEGAGSGGSPWKTITAALATLSGSEASPVIINIAAGTYAASTNGETFPLNMEDWVSLSGEDRQTTILDAEGAAYHVIYCDGADNLTIEGLTITGGYADGSGANSNGAGIYCSNSSPTIRDNIITDNVGKEGDGGGIYCYQSSPVIDANDITSNRQEKTSISGNGGGISCEESSPTITNNNISNNFAGNGAGGIRCVSNSAPLIEGNTVSGNDANDDGGGILCGDSAPTIKNNTISGNTTDNTGGGVRCRRASPTIQNNTITGNSATDGGGVFCQENSSPSVKHNIISDNSASNDGGGVCCWDSSSPTVENNLIVGNTASDDGGGVFADDESSPALKSNTILRNEASGDGGAIYCSNTSAPTVINSILWANSPDEIDVDGSSSCSVTYSCIKDWSSGGTGNISDDPLFVYGCYLGQKAAGQSSDSPCVDKGSASASTLGLHQRTTRTDGIYDTGRVDMGYHFTSGPSRYYVDADSGSDSNDGSEANPWKTITHALDSAPAGATDPTIIHVAAGAYSDSTNGETFPLNMRSWVSLSGENRSATILDAEDAAYHVIRCDDVNHLTIEGLTITGGSADGTYPDDCGGGIYGTDSSPTIVDNIIKDNSADYHGGGAWWDKGSPTIRGNLVADNAAGWSAAGLYCHESPASITENRISGNHAGDCAGAICSWYSSSKIYDNVIENNTADNDAGAIFCDGGAADLENNLIANNSAENNGGAIRCYSGTPVFRNNTINGNSASNGGAIWCSNGSTLTVVNSILWGNSPNEISLNGCSSDITYSCIQDWSSGGTGNISSDPLFAYGCFLSQTAAGQSEDSPCVDAGSDTAANLGMDDRRTRTDIAADSGQVDMGYHYPMDCGLANTAWPMYQRDVRHTGRSPYAGPKTPTVKWTYQLNPPRYMCNGPVLGHDSVIYSGSLGSPDFFAISSDGSLLWSFDLPNGFYYPCAAVAQDGSVYFGDDDNDFYALNSDGTLKWSHAAGDLFSGSAAICPDGTIYQGCEDRKLYAFEPDGRLKWTFEGASQIESGPAIAEDGTVYFTCYGGGIYAINSDGTQKWSNGYGCRMASPSIGIDGTVYVGHGAQLCALDPSDGSLIWSYSLGDDLNAAPAIGDDGAIYATSGNGRLTSMESDGALRWSFDTGQYLMLSTPLVDADGVIYFGTMNGEEGTVWAIDSGGSLVWSLQTPDPVCNSPAALGEDGTLYIWTNVDGILYAIQDEEGHYYVDADSGDDGNDGSWGNPYKTITGALGSVSGSESAPVTVHVRAGAYSASTNGETFPLTMESWVSLSGEDRDTTILDAEDSAYHVIVCDSVDNLTVEHLTITGGNANGSSHPDDVGGGIYCCQSSPTIQDNVIMDNAADEDGAGVYCEQGSATILDNDISSNSAQDSGGGIYCHQGSTIIQSNEITGNTAQGAGEGYGGGGVFCTGGSTTIQNNNFSGCSANQGGGISLYNSPSTLGENVIGGNSATTLGGGIYCIGSSPVIESNAISDNVAASGGGVYVLQASATIRNNIMADNHTSLDGGAVFVDDDTASTIENNLMVANTARYGGALFLDDNSSPAMSGNTIAHNEASRDGGAIYCGNSSSPTVIDSILWADSPDEIYLDGTSSCNVTYSCIEDWSGGGTGNISSDPLLVYSYFLSQTAAGQVSNSPCVDAGSDTAANLGLDDRTTRGDGEYDTGTVDMGYHPKAGPGKYYVDADTGSNSNDGTQDHPWKTITHALDSVSGEPASPAVICVAAGTYAASTNGEAFPLSMESWVSLSGEDRETTILDAETAAYHVIYSDAADHLTIEHLTMTRGYANGSGVDHAGGGIYVKSGRPLLSDCIITGNLATDSGGGIFCGQDGSAIIRDCIISGNTATDSGGGIGSYKSSPIIGRSTIVDNAVTAGAYGGAGICCGTDTSPTVSDCVISGNVIDHGDGAGIDCHGDTPTITNCLIIDNTASDGNGGGIHCYNGVSPTVSNCTLAGNTASGDGGGLCAEDSSSVAVVDSILWGDSSDEVHIDGTSSVAITYSCIEGGHTGTGNTDSDPLFIAGPDGDYYLTQASAGQSSTSPCVDTGSDAAANLGMADRTTRTDRWTDTGTVDMGYHYSPQGISYFVDADAGDNGNDGSGGAPWRTITFALASVSGSEAAPVTIHLAAGTYAASTNGEAFPLTMESWVSLSGEGYDTTILDAEDAAYHVIYCDSVDSLTIEGLRITGGNASYPLEPGDRGAGVYCEYSSLSLSNCTITLNTAKYGAGLYCKCSSPILTGSWFTNNSTSQDGAGIYCSDSSSPEITDCRIIGNTGTTGGVRCQGNSSPILSGCTISDNTGSSTGGIRCSEGSPTLGNCVVSDNEATGAGTVAYGGGLFFDDDSSPSLINVLVIRNSSGDYGGGICFGGGAPTVEHCIIADNAATLGGGAIHCQANSSPTISDTLIGNNSAEYGGGVCCLDTDPTLVNCTIAASESQHGAIYLGNYSDAVVTDSILWNDSSVEIDFGTGSNSIDITYSCIKGSYSGTGNIDEDPLFVGDYYLSQTAAGQGSDSPCVDAGSDTAANLSLDDRTTRTDGVGDSGTVDMGYHHIKGTRDYYVDGDSGSDGNDGLTWGTAFATIQQGIDSCTVGAEGDPEYVHVAAGAYTESITLDDHVTLWGGYPSGGGSRDPASNATIIDGSGSGVVVTINGKQNVKIDGFTITNGYSSMVGAGVDCRSSSPSISNCTIANCVSDLFGGGLSFLSASAPTLSECVIIGNQAGDFGGAVYSDESTPTVEHCIIKGNSAGDNGGGIWSQKSSLTLRDCLITDNSAEYGAGLQVHSSTSTISNCTIANNVADHQGGGIYFDSEGVVTVEDSILWGDYPDETSGSGSIAVTYSCVQGGHEGDGNIDDDPQFANGYYLSQTAAGQGSNSPCVDSGSDTAANLGLSTRTTRTDGAYDGGTVDMGYHYSSETDNDSPVLSDPNVDPEVGTSETSFTFSIHYYDEDGDEPSIKRVYVDDTSHDMSGSGANATYTFATDGLSTGEHDFYFYFEDENGGWDRDPDDGAHSGPLVDDTAPWSSCSSEDYSTRSTVSAAFTAGDGGGSGLYRTHLYYRYESGSWTYYGYETGTSGTISFSASDGEGTYYFQTVAEDNAGNMEAGPSGDGDDSTVYDGTAPSSACTSPACSSSSAINVSFNTTDTGGSGIYRTNLYYKYGSSGSWTYCDNEAGTSGTIAFTAAEGQGLYYFQTVAEDNAGNVEVGPSGNGDDSTMYDATKPSSSCSSPQCAKASPVVVNFAAGDAHSGIASVALWFNHEGGAWTDSGLADGHTSGSFNFDPQNGDGTYEFYTIATDEAGNTEDAPGAADDSTVYDSTAPTSSCESPERENAPQIVVSYTASDALSGIASVSLWYSYAGGSWTDSGLSESGDSGSFDFSPEDGDGMYEFYTIATDKAGNAESAPGTADDSTVYDTESPESSCSSPQVENSSPIVVNYTASDALSAIQSVCLWYNHDGEGWTDSGLSDSATSGSFNFGPGDGDGTYEFYTVASDTLGNTEDAPQTADSTTVYDTGSPASSCESPENANSPPIVVTYTASDPLSDIASVDLWYSYDGGGWTDTGLSDGGTAGAFEFTPADGDGLYEFYTIATDAAGNTEDAPGTADSATVYDTGKPVSSCESPDDANSSPIVVSYTASDPVSGIASVDLWYNYEGEGWIDSGLSDSGTSGTLEFHPPHGDGTYEFYTIATNNAGSSESPPSKADSSTNYDTEAPVSSCSCEYYGSSSTVGITYEAGGSLSGIAEVVLWYSYASGDWLDSGYSDSATSGVIDFAPPGGDGVYEFYTIAVDKAGNVEAPPDTADDSMIYDTTSPTSACQSASHATSSPVSVTFEADDALSGVAVVALWYSYEGEGWTDSGLTEAGTSGAIDFTPTEGDGVYEFYTVATDEAGNDESAPGAADSSTVYDTDAPASFCESPENDNTLPIAVSYIATDAVSGIASVELWYSYAGGDWLNSGLSDGGTSGTLEFTPTEGEGPYEFYSIGVDVAGNVEEAPGAADSLTIYDATPPESSCSTDDYATCSPITVVYQASDAHSGVVSVALWFRFNDGDWTDSGLSDSGTSGTLEFAPDEGDGTYGFYTIAADRAGNVEASPGEEDDTTVYDAQAPQSECESPEYCNTSPIIVSYEASDATSGVAHVDLWYNYDDEGWKDSGVSESGTSGTMNFTPAEGDGTYRFYTIAADRAGNVEAPPSEEDDTTVYDTQPPSSLCTGPDYANTQSLHLTSSSIDLEFDAHDSLSGVASVALWCSYSGGGWVDTGITSDDATQGTLEFELTQGDGTYGFFTIAVDRAGNQEAPPDKADASTVHDTIAPESSGSCIPLTNDSPALVDYTSNDERSGVASVSLYYCYSDGDYKDSGLSEEATSGTFLFEPGQEYGFYSIYTLAVDAAGNVEDAPECPDATCYFDERLVLSEANSPDYSTDATVSVEFTTDVGIDGYGGIRLYYRYCETIEGIEAEPWITTSTISSEPSGALSFHCLDGDGFYQFYTRAWSESGILEPAPSTADATTMAEWVPPQTHVSTGAISASEQFEVSFWTTASDLVSMDIYYWYQQDWSLWTTVYETSGTITFDTGGIEGEFRFYSIGKDTAGNEEAPPAEGWDCAAVVDLSPPWSSATTQDECSNTEPIEVGFTAGDLITGVRHVELYFKNGVGSEWVLFGSCDSITTGQFDFAPPCEGDFYFHTIAVDEAGHREAPPSTPDARSIYDVTPPATSCQSPDYAKETMEVQFEAEDALSGVASVDVHYRFDSGTWVKAYQSTTTSSGAFEFAPPSGDGLYEFSVSASDHCGNAFSPAEEQCSTVYDTVKPNSSCSSAKSLVTGDSITLDYSVPNELSGVESVAFWYRYNEGKWRLTSLEGRSESGTVKFTITSTDGVYAFYSVATDRAGNVEDTPQGPDCEVTVDRTTPVLSEGKVSPTTGPAGIDYRFTVRYSDAEALPPSVKNVVIDGEPYTMLLLSGTPDSGTYGYQKQLSTGKHQFRFHFEDAFGVSANLPSSGTFSGPSVRAAPTLSDGSASPTLCDTRSPVEFTVSYGHADGDAPSLIQVVVDDQAFNMSPPTRAPFEGTYRYKTTLDAGVHRYYFHCEDSLGGEARLPEGWGAFDGPTVVEYDDEEPYPSDLAPRRGATDVDPSTRISIELLDDISGVDGSSIELRVNGALVQPSISNIQGGVVLSYAPPKPFAQKMKVEVEVSACDRALVPNCLELAYYFRTADKEPPVIVNGPTVISVGMDSALIEWLTNELADSVVEYYSDVEEPFSTCSSVMSTLHSVELHSLSPGTMYHFRVGSTDKSGNGPSYSALDTFTTGVYEDTSPPSVLTGPAATAVSSNSATVIWTTDEPSMGHLEYSPMGREASERDEESFSRHHSLMLRDLRSDIEYECVLTCVDSSDNWSSPSTLWFHTTLQDDQTPPEIVEGPAAIHTDATKAVIGFRTNELSDCSVEYGTTEALGCIATEAVASFTHDVFLNDLTPGSKYHYRVLCWDLMGNGPTSSEDCIFTTLPRPDKTGLVCTSGPAITYLADRSAKIEWTTNKVSNTKVDYWKASSSRGESGTITWQDGTATREHEAFLSGLLPDTEYCYIAFSRDLAGNSMPPEGTYTFRTERDADISPPGISSVSCRYAENAKVRIDWDTSEPGDSRIYYWKAGSRQSGKDSWAGGENTMTHSGWLTGLAAGSRYEYEVGSSDMSGNIAWSETSSFETSARKDDEPPTISSGPSAGTRGSSGTVSIIWETDEIADTVVEFGPEGGPESDESHWASYEHVLQHRVVLAGLTPGAYEYTVWSRDPAGNVSLPGEGTFYISGDKSQARLINPGVSPSYGSLSTKFEYRISYEDSEGSTPNRSNVIINGNQSRAMHLRNGAPNNGVYVYSAQLPQGTHSYEFEFESSSGQVVKSPETGAYNGPRAAPIPSFSLAIGTNKSLYFPGDLMSVWVDVSNGGDPYDADVYIYVTLPDGSRLYWPRFTPKAEPVSLLPFPAKTSFDGYEILSMQLQGIPSGNYEWHASLCEHNTPDRLCPAASSAFAFSNQVCFTQLELDDTKSVPGDEMALRLYVTNYGQSIDADLYACLALPNGSSLYLPGFTTESTPMSLSVPGGCERKEYELLRATIPPGLPSGEYEWAASLCHGGATEPISDEARIGFELYNVKVEIETNSTNLTVGDSLVASLSLRNYGPDIDLDLCVGITLADGEVLYLPSMTQYYSPYRVFRPLAEGERQDGIQVMNVPLSTGIPSGTYGFFAWFNEADSETRYGKQTTCSWQFSP